MGRSEKRNKRFPRNSKNGNFVSKISFWSRFHGNETFIRKWVMSVSSPYGSLTSWKVSDKNSERFLTNSENASFWPENNPFALFPWK